MTNSVSTEAARRSPLPSRLRWALTSLGAAAALAACGGGGGDDAPAPAPEPPAPVATTLTGTAATGAPFAGAALQVTDASGASVCDTTTAADGSFSCTLAPTAVRPLVLRAVKDDQTLYSATAAAGDTRANVTPLTTIIAARLAPNGDPAKLAAAPQSVTAAALQAQSSALLAALQPLLTALGLTIDPIAGALTADGTGQDKLLDSISVTVQPSGTSANIEVTVKTVPTSAGAQPEPLKFSSSDASLPTVSTTTVAALAPVPAPSKVADLFKRMNDCYALPLTQRVDSATSDTTSAIGTASNVKAAVCRGLFQNSDPATFLSNKVGVGRNANNAGAFASLFRAGATGLQWTAGEVEFFRANGDMVISHKWVDTAGNQDFDLLAAHADADGTLRLVGNSNTYPVTIRPFSEDRDMLNTPAFSYYTTGYNIQVDNRTANGASIFSKVMVTSPLGLTLTMLPQPGLSYLTIAPDGVTPTGSPVLRLAGAYRDTAVAGNPQEKESLVYTTPQYSEAQIAALDNNGVWTIEFFHADSNVPNVVQYYRTVRRAETIGEIRNGRVFAELTPTLRTELVAQSQANGYVLVDTPEVAYIDTDAGGDAWSVPRGALAPTSASLYGRAPFGSTTAGQNGARFNDSAGVASTARKTIIYCSAQTLADKHCDAGGQGRYAAGTTVNMLELWARSPKQVEVSKKAALYKLQ
nr:Ig-like domain-containing protein [Variovorax boronicumulans]